MLQRVPAVFTQGTLYATVAIFVAVIVALAVVATASAAVRQAPSLSELDAIPRPDEKLLIDPSGS